MAQGKVLTIAIVEVPEAAVAPKPIQKSDPLLSSKF
jgi:hypothetical protein